MKKIPRILAPIALVLSLFPGTALPLDTIADIKCDVTMDFGVYRPLPVDVTPDATSYTIAPDFKNVVNFKDFAFSTEQEDLLRKNGFVAAPGSFLEMYDAYNKAKEEGLPVFVTVDALLHAYHELFDFALRTIETRKLLEDADALTSALLAASFIQYTETSDPTVRDAAFLNTAYFAVAMKLLDPASTVPEPVRTLANQELALIDAHSGMNSSPIFGYSEDYSQYIPRGHYTLSEDLKKYFRAMMWYGRMSFHAEPSIFLGVSSEMAEKATRRALLMARAAAGLKIRGHGALEVWERIYLPTTFFVGKSEDLDLYQYLSIGEKTYGAPLDSIPLDRFSNEAELELFLGEIRKLPPPAIVPEWGKGFRLMGQRFIPDSYMFTELVFPRTQRYFPRGLDVMAVLGSNRADEILDKVFHENTDTSYTAQMDRLKAEFKAMDDSVWAQNLYWNWLYCLMPLLAPKGTGFPPYMQTAAWEDKELSCALGSWAELRHDTILYAKQSYTCGVADFGFNASRVEPNPWAFARLASLTRLTLEGLANQGLLFEEFESRLEELHSLLLDLKQIAEKELENRALSIEEKRRILLIGETLAWLTIFEDANGIGDDLEDDMSVIADVHTDLLVTNKCLEEGVGRPLDLYVIVDAGGELAVALGSAFSYYEFAWPMADRLTDEAWKKMLSTTPPPLLPVWMESYIDLATPPPPGLPYNYANHTTFGNFKFDMTLDPATPTAGDAVEIRITCISNPRAPLALEAIRGKNRTLVKLTPDASTPAPLDYVGTLDTTGWDPGDVSVTVYSPERADIFSVDSFYLKGKKAAAGRGMALR